MYDVLFMSSLVTGTLFVLVAWFIYKYSSFFPEIERYWAVISVGFLIFAAGEFMEALTNVGMSGDYSLVVSIVGSVLLLGGFYRLYYSHKV